MTVLTKPQAVIAITCTVNAVLAAGTVVELTDDYTVNKPAADSGKVLGRLLKASLEVGDKRAVETQFRRVEPVTLTETVVAGDPLKIGADGATDNQRFAKWATGANEAVLLVAIALEGGDADEAVDAGFLR